MAPRQDPIPDSYIRRCVTKDGKTRWNVRHYDPTTRRTVTLGTFAALAEAKAAYRARESGVSAAARDAAGAAAKSAGAKSERAPKPSAAARAATAAPARAAPRAKKGEKRKKPASASAAPPPPRRRRRRSSAETAATTAIVVASPARAAARTPRDSARMRNLADAALFAAKASVQKRLPPKKRALDDENASDPAAGQRGDASPVSSVSAGTTPRLASPRRRRGSLILAPSFSPPTRAAARERAQALCDAAAVANDEDDKDGRAAKSSSSSSHGTRRRARSRRSVLGGIARRLSDGLLGVLSRAGRPAQLRGGQTLVPAEGPGWRWSAGGEDGGEDGVAVARKTAAARPRATAEAVDVSVGDFRAAMAAAGVVVQHRVRLSLTAAGEEEEEEEEE